MGSKKSEWNPDPNVNAYGTTMRQSEANRIGNYNEANRQEGQTKDTNQTNARQAVVNKNGTVDYKKTIRSRFANTWKSILGIK